MIPREASEPGFAEHPSPWPVAPNEPRARATPSTTQRWRSSRRGWNGLRGRLGSAASQALRTTGGCRACRKTRLPFNPKLYRWSCFQSKMKIEISINPSIDTEIRKSQTIEISASRIELPASSIIVDPSLEEGGHQEPNLPARHEGRAGSRQTARGGLSCPRPAVPVPGILSGRRSGLGGVAAFRGTRCG